MTHLRHHPTSKNCTIFDLATEITNILLSLPGRLIIKDSTIIRKHNMQAND